MGEKEIKPPLAPATPAGDGAARRTGGENTGGGGGSHQNNNRRHHNNNSSHPSPSSKFVSRNKGIEHDIFDNTGNNDAAQFNKSLIQIADDLLEKLDHGRDVSDAVHNMTEAKIDIPRAYIAK